MHFIFNKKKKRQQLARKWRRMYLHKRLIYIDVVDA